VIRSNVAHDTWARTN